MKTAVFKFFDEFCYGELVYGEINEGAFEIDGTKDWAQPINFPDTFGYSKKEQILFFNGEIEDSIRSIYGVESTDFKEYFKEWFIGKYRLSVSLVI
jgi:hypothetical protein